MFRPAMPYAMIADALPALANRRWLGTVYI